MRKNHLQVVDDDYIEEHYGSHHVPTKELCFEFFKGFREVLVFISPFIFFLWLFF